MTRAQYRVYNRLAAKQVNRARDITIVDSAAQYVTFHLAFTGLYLTYDNAGYLMSTETQAQREAGKKQLANPGSTNLVIGGEMGSESYGERRPEPVVIDDDIPY
jgi:hypothetical protein